MYLFNSVVKDRLGLITCLKLRKNMQTQTNQVSTTDPLLSRLAREEGFTDDDFKRLELFWEPAFNNSWLYLSSEIVHEHLGHAKHDNSMANFSKKMRTLYIENEEFKEVSKDYPIIKLYLLMSGGKNFEARGGSLKKYYLITGATYKMMTMQSKTARGKESRLYYIKVENLARKMLKTINDQQRQLLELHVEKLKNAEEQVAEAREQENRLRTINEDLVSYKLRTTRDESYSDSHNLFKPKFKCIKTYVSPIQVYKFINVCKHVF